MKMRPERLIPWPGHLFPAWMCVSTGPGPWLLAPGCAAPGGSLALSSFACNGCYPLPVLSQLSPLVCVGDSGSNCNMTSDPA